MGVESRPKPLVAGLAATVSARAVIDFIDLPFGEHSHSEDVEPARKTRIPMRPSSRCKLREQVV
jgi:hypothetical protein